MTKNRLATTLLAVVLCWLAPGVAWAEKPPRYSALLANGQRVEGHALTDWQNNGAQPRIDGQPLLDEGNMLRWQRDRWLLPGALPKAFVEMHTGDRFPGTVVDFAQGNVSVHETLPGHFCVRPEIELRPQEKQREPIVRIVSQYVRRIAWAKRERDDYQPNTLFYRDGRAQTFRAIRFGEGFANVLLADGNRRVNFHELAEIHLAAANPWEIYFDELATLCLSSDKARLFQLETVQGLILTGSTDRRQFGGDNKPDQWIHGLQPAWSLDVIYVPGAHILARRLWLPHEVPLSHIAPSQVVASSPLSTSGPAPQLNRNVQGGPLRAGNQDFGFGFGVQANSELTFDLIEGVKGLRGRVGLDKISGRGGCIRARVFANDTHSPPLWESPYLVGSEQTADLGIVSLVGPAQGQKKLVLQVDAAHQGRPTGADPLDVRDTTDWLDPVIELDPVVLQQKLAQRRFQLAAAWRDWQVSQAPDGQTPTHGYWNDLANSPGDYHLAISARNKPIVLTREFNLTPQDNWLVVFVNRYPHGGPAPKLEVWIGGEAVAEYEVPARHRGNEDKPPLAVSLANYRTPGKPLLVEIRQTPVSSDGYVDWSSIQTFEQLPYLYRVFEDQGNFTALDAEQRGSTKLYAEDRHYGTHSVQVLPHGQFQLKFPQTIAIREQPKWGEYRFIRFAFRKSGEGRLGLEITREGDTGRKARYTAGPGEPAYPDAVRLWNDKLPNHWIVQTRDLYGEFGAMDATGITLTVPDGEYALFDHIYFARQHENFNLIPNAPTPDVVNQKARRELAQHLLDRGYPAVVAIETDDGRFGTGVVLWNQGEVLTAGHVVANPDQPCKVHLADGRIVDGQTRGIDRDLDLGVVKITTPGEYKFLERGDAREIPEQQLYIGFTHKQKYAKGDKPETHLAGIRRVFRGMIWTDFDLDDFSAGGPLINRDGRVIGVLTKRSEFGGFLFSRLEEFDPRWDRMRRGEVFGTWYPGTGPMVGINVQSTRDGAKVLELVANSPATSANLQPGDIVTKVEGRSVVSLDDIYAILADKNAGQEAQLEIRRDGQTEQTKLKLAPRVP